MLIGKMHQSHIYQNRSGADVRARDISQSQKSAPIAMPMSILGRISMNVKCIALHFVAMIKLTSMLFVY